MNQINLNFQDGNKMMHQKRKHLEMYFSVSLEPEVVEGVSVRWDSKTGLVSQRIRNHFHKSTKPTERRDIDPLSI